MPYCSKCDGVHSAGPCPNFTEITPQVKPRQTFTANDSPIPAGFWLRLIARMIDWLVTYSIIAAATYPLFMIMHWYVLLVVIPLTLIIGWFYYVVYQSNSGQTIGRKIMNIKIVTLRERSPTLATLTLRWIIGGIYDAITIIPTYYTMLPALLLYLLVASGDKRSVVDYLSGTKVIRCS